MLKAENIRMHYTRDRLVLDGLAFEVGRGQIMAILGPNGSGKTTLLKCVNAMLTPQTGVVTVEDQAIFELNPTEIARILGYVPQHNKSRAHDDLRRRAAGPQTPTWAGGRARTT